MNILNFDSIDMSEVVPKNLKDSINLYLCFGSL